MQRVASPDRSPANRRRPSTWRDVGCALIAIVLGLAWAPTAFAEPPATPAPTTSPRPLGSPRLFVQIKDDLWRAGNGNWWSLIYVTPDGILLVDPISTDFAGWLRGELARRFPDKPVRYIVYSHSHWDHIGGAAVFADSHPHIVGQERMLGNMDGRWPHMPGDLIDRNNDGIIEAEDFAIPTLEHPGICGMGRGSFESMDKTNSGHITIAQWWAVNGVTPPDMVYSDRMTIILGGRTIRLVFPGLNHADDGTVLLFPAERVAFSTDFPADALVTTSMRSFPSACGMFDRHPLSEWIKSYRTIEGLDFDILAQGHGQVTFAKADVTEGRQFFEDLRDSVQAGISSGKSLEELKKTLMLDKYKTWAYYDMLRPEVIESAYLNLKNYR
jgi:glyoxylase-like metal-dependent hydrolase (beta-lactamase superfamily II)